MPQPKDQQDFTESLQPVDTETPLEVSTMYRIAYESEMGREVLGHLLDRLGMFHKIQPGDEQAIGRHNAAVEILTTLGIVAPGNMWRIVDALLSIPLENKEK